MSDVQDLPEPQAVSTTELVNLLVNATESCSSQPTQFNHNSSENNGLGLGALFGAESEEDSGHSADGNEFHPTAERGWTADWTPLSLSQIAVDYHRIVRVERSLSTRFQTLFILLLKPYSP
ncbi:hypothetical protein PSHT_01991 [Puccinia striiformis]|uniref:Uncharacterized protein n=1 Tax=Puccinia striiformis TaxID=27350 RepID=A0A2S4WJ86_9BASI|nr:hypothetical protein PSHT_01991 [Puccinia striiformis]